ncbi:undecaprenyldiphospho-muramoylpentapeptide beta-N-acetylglucosaminyltransferase [Candidatus Aerophobetes bacterium]|nr:undecaprenyldiphospho-muramoylpentapeptide beta-N-acetylglucosaminyltransferase [Candidatus Aerophobetes bacterium]
MKVLIAAGGTGGHLYPALAIASYLKKIDYTNCILWVGGKRTLEFKIVSSEGFKFKKISIQSYPRTLSIKWATFWLNLWISFAQSLVIILWFKPQVVVGAGSFHSYPIVMLSFFLGIPTLICEQNLHPSLSNRFLCRWASKIAISFPQTKDFFPLKVRNKLYFTGNPLRSQIFKLKREDALIKLGLDKDKFTLLFTGGSQGAHSLNLSAIEAIKLLEKKEGSDKKIQVIFITGKNDFKWVEESLKTVKIKSLILSYLNQMEYAYNASDLIICRSGATTISEITALGLPAILIPYPYATEEHQLKNAEVLQKNGAALIITEKELRGEGLKENILKLINDRNLLKEMGKKGKALGKPEATEEIVKIIYSLAKKTEKAEKEGLKGKRYW